MSEKNDGEGIDSAKKPKKPRKAPAKKPAKTPAEALGLKREASGSLNPWDDEPASDPRSIDSAPNTEWDGKLPTGETVNLREYVEELEANAPASEPAPPKPANGSAALSTTEDDTGTATCQDSQETTDGSTGNQASTVRSTPQLTTDTSGNIVGDVPVPDVVAELLDGETPPVILVALARVGESRAACWERLRKEARAVGMPRGQGSGSAYEWATREVERLFPPKVKPAPEPEIPEVLEELPVDVCTIVHIEAEQPEESTAPIATSPPVDNGVSGLGDLPEAWGTLPANAQLQVEIAWVSANRLRVRSGSGVDLSRALSPAPSYSALSWLETSILFPSKFADISVKATSQQDDEREGIRREKLAIEEIRSLLAEMLEG